jgi:hypothetical protein
MVVTNTSSHRIEFQKGVNMETKAEEVWIHGSIAEVEVSQFPHGGSIIRTSAGIMVQSNGDDHWVHFPIPTPVITSGQRMMLNDVFVLFKALGKVKIGTLRVFDGSFLVKSFDDLAATGDHSTEVHDQNTWSVGPHRTKFGLVISVYVVFPTLIDGGGPLPEVFFSGVGATFSKLPIVKM